MQIFNKTSDLHNRLIQIGVISFNTPVLYVGVGNGEFAYNKYDPTVVAVVEPNAMFDEETWKYANYMNNTCLLYYNINNVIEYYDVIIGNYPGITSSLYDWTDVLDIKKPFYFSVFEVEVIESDRLFKKIDNNIYYVNR